MSVRLEGACKTYVMAPERVVALDGIDLHAAAGELLVVVGPSGSGKTTLLRSIAGLEPLDAGRVEVGGRDVTTLPPGRRAVSMVFQEHALFPHMTVGENVSFGLRARKTGRQAAARRVADAAELLGIVSLLERRPHEISGGERQRVALARAVVREPDAFLMDEPLSGLDAELRARMRGEVKALQRRLDTTTVYVTHDQIEALTMGDRVAVLRSGRIEQIAPPKELYERPANAFVARFLGSPPMNVFPASLCRQAGDAGAVGVRPEKIRIVPGGDGTLAGRVSAVENVGHEAVVHVECDGHRVAARAELRGAPAEGAEVGLAFDDRDVYLFEGLDGAARPRR